MNIYEETKVITHEEARKRILYEMDTSSLYDVDILFIKTYITQQEAKEQRAKKVEELLGLYRAKDNIIEKYIKNSFAYFSELERLSYEIKALEKELEEME